MSGFYATWGFLNLKKQLEDAFYFGIAAKLQLKYYRLIRDDVLMYYIFIRVFLIDQVISAEELYPIHEF